MWTRRRTWLLLAALVGVALAVYFEPTHCVRGWLRGEAFFDGRPTSWWRGVVERDLRQDPRVILGQAPPAPPGWWDRWKARIGFRAHVQTAVILVREPAADVVLHELRADKDEKIAAFAGDILDQFRSMEGLEILSLDPAEVYWMSLVNKHNLGHPPLDNRRSHLDFFITAK